MRFDMASIHSANLIFCQPGHENDPAGNPYRPPRLDPDNLCVEQHLGSRRGSKRSDESKKTEKYCGHARVHSQHFTPSVRGSSWLVAYPDTNWLTPACYAISRLPPWGSSRRERQRIAQGGTLGTMRREEIPPCRGGTKGHSSEGRRRFLSAPPGRRFPLANTLPGFCCAPPWAILLSSLREEKRCDFMLLRLEAMFRPSGRQTGSNSTLKLSKAAADPSRC